MKNLPLIFKGSDWTNKYRQTKGFARNYHTIKISGCTKWNNIAMKVLGKLVSNLRMLEFESCKFTEQHVIFLENLFSSFNKLEVLQFRFTEILFDLSHKKLKALKQHALPHLKKVVFSDSHINVSQEYSLINIYTR